MTPHGDERGRSLLYATCLTCGATFRTTASRQRKGFDKFCCNACYLTWRRLPQAERRCTLCGETKTAAEFPKSTHNRARLYSWCLPCKSARQLARRRANPERVLDIRLKSTFGIDLASYLRLLRQQNGRCAICRVDAPGVGFTRFPVDHDHITGKVRGLLCAQCNAGLGNFRDDPERLARAIEYLRLPNHHQAGEDTELPDERLDR